MADGRLTRTTVQALASVDRLVASPTVDQAVVDPKSPDYQLAGVPPASDAQVLEIAVKRKRGRPPRNPAAPPPSNDIKRSKKEDEDVCFICFDGGSLVLCDRRDCPKAYHPACVKRDESFFRRNIRWNCGWHLCNTCQRNALFMCYTCPYSLCKGCVKQADILCVRGNKGFCRNCMTTIMLIENIPQEGKELVQVDFDDTSSWEYLFKVYWVLLKQKESFTLDELTRATNPWKVSGLDHKDHFPQQIQDTSVCKVSNLSSSDIHLEANGTKRRKTRKQPQLLNMTSQKVGTADLERVPQGRADWASKELLEFVAHMKNGDTSVHSQFDVQALLLDYIRTNNLRDPRQKCQIICDRRLENLFGKSRVGHFEMLKLLEYHFKEESRTNGMIRGASIDALAGQVEAEGITGDIQTPSREMKRQTRRKGDEKGQQNNLDSYAAIDVHNINLIYLKQSLLKNLILDAEKFHDKVVGSIVRIRISSNDQKQDMHRLVRIIGTTKACEPYKIGDKTENIMLRILNLNKIEDVLLDAISDQEFSEDECRRLRQSIKLGLVERMTVGEIQEKAMALQTMRVNDWLETEIMRLNHLRDRASEMGHRKELRECVEKIELLKTPEERQRRIYEIPEVHADPRMDPSYGSDDDSGESDIKKQDGSLTPKYSNSISKAMEMISPVRVGDVSKDDKAKTLKTSAVNGERKRKISAKFHVGKMEGTTRHLRSSAKPEKGVDATSRVSEELSNQADSGIGSGDHGAPKIGSLSQAAPDSSTTTPSSGMVPISDITELEKIWHYQDPSGKVQGPFCMLQLRKWNSSGFFPTDLRVWRINETQNQSILLNDALRNQHHCEAVLQQGTCLQSHDGGKSDESKGSSVEEPNTNNGAPWIGCKPNEEGNKSNLTNRVSASDGTERSVCDEKTQQVYSDQGASHMTPKTESSDLASPTPKSDNVMESQAVNNGPSSLGTGAPDSATNCITTSNGTDTSDLPHSIMKSKPENLKGPNVENKHPVTSDICKDLLTRWETGSSADEVSDAPDPIPKTVNKEVKDHDTDNKHSDALVEHDSGKNSTVPDRADISVLPSAAAKVDNEVLKSHDSENRHTTSNLLGILFSDIPDTDLKLESKGLRTAAAENKHFDAANVPGQDSGTTWSCISGGIAFADLPATSLKLEDDGGRSVENKHRVAQDSCINWSTASRLVGEVHLTDVPSEWGAFPSLHAKPSVEEFNLVSGSSAKLAEVANDHTTPTSDSCQLTHCSPSHPDCDPSAWQPIELSTLGDESVSDLLSEVEAMESLRGMSYCGDDSIGSSRDDCFSPLEGLSPNMDPVKSDGLSSTVDMHFQIQPNHADQQHEAFTIDINDIPRTSCILSNPSPDVEEGVKPAIASMPHHNVVSEPPPPKLLPPPLPPPPPSPPPPPPPPPPPSTLSVDCPSSPIEEGEVDPTYVSVHHPEVVPQKQPSPRTAGMKTLAADTSWKQGPVQDNAKFSGTGSILGNPNMHWSNSSQGMATTATGANMHWTTSVASQGTRASQTSPRYSHSVGRHSGPKDRSHHHHGVDSGFGKSRTASWSRQSSFGGGGGSSRPPHRGQRVCKFYESGYCKKGASCKYLHP